MALASLGPPSYYLGTTFSDFGRDMPSEAEHVQHRSVLRGLYIQVTCPACSAQVSCPPIRTATYCLPFTE